MNGGVWFRGESRSYLGTVTPPCWIMSGTKAYELYHSKKPIMKVPGVETYQGCLADSDKAWRKAEGRKPFAELSEREQMLEGAIPWDPVRLKELTAQHLSIQWCNDERTPVQL